MINDATVGAGEGNQFRIGPTLHSSAIESALYAPTSADRVNAVRDIALHPAIIGEFYEFFSPLLDDADPAVRSEAIKTALSIVTRTITDQRASGLLKHQPTPTTP
jgi:hypothetical protein